MANNTKYSGLFIRDRVGENPQDRQGGSWTNSPDIIVTGTTPIDDPSELTNKSNWNKGEPKGNKQVPENKNFVYIRGENINAPESTSTVYFYYAQQSISLLPKSWKTEGITFNGKAGNSAKINVGKNGDIVAVSAPSFIWTPPKSKDHYCLIAWAENGKDQSTPPKLPSIETWSQLANFILDHPNIAWKNLQEIKPDKNSIVRTVNLDNPKKGKKIQVGLRFENIPGGGDWEFSIPLEGKKAFKRSGKTRNQEDQPYSELFTVQLPSFATTMTFTYTLPPGVTKFPKEARIETLVSKTVTKKPVADKLKSVAPFRMIDIADFDGIDSKQNDEEVLTLMVLGSVIFEIKNN